MLGLEAVVIVGIAILVSYVAARRFRVAAPIMLLVSGVLIGLIPQLRTAALPPELVLLVRLPVLLYWESLTTSMREIRANLTAIAVLATVLVAATAAGAAVVGHALGLAWGPAWVLGAAVAPTDATATAALGRLFPSRQVTILRAESLINDGTALVIYGVAVGVTVGEQTLTLGSVTWQILVAYGGGALVGALVALINSWLRRRLQEALLGNLVMLLAPFGAYMLAELIDASGVIAVVISGLIMSQVAPRIIRAQHRTQALAFWPLFTFIINAALFVFVGIELHQVGRTFTGPQLTSALTMMAAVSAAVIAIRVLFVFGSAIIGTVANRLRNRHHDRSGSRETWLNSLAGFRGAISIAVALSIPDTIADGTVFPSRNLIIFVTAGFVVVTLVGQALLVQLIARPSVDRDDAREHDEAVVSAFRAARAALPSLAERLKTSSAALEWLRQEYDTYLGAALARTSNETNDTVVRDREDYVRLSLELIAHRRDTVIQLRDAGTIDDAALRQLQANLDAEEIRLTEQPPTEE